STNNAAAQVSSRVRPFHNTAERSTTNVCLEHVCQVHVSLVAFNRSCLGHDALRAGRALCRSPGPLSPTVRRVGGTHCAMGRITWACLVDGSYSSTQSADLASSRPMAAASMFLYIDRRK